MERLGLPALFTIALIESAGIPLPIPYYLLLMNAGVSHRSSLLAGAVVVVVCGTATILGSLGLFALTRLRGSWLLGRYSTYLGLGESRMNRMRAWYSRHGRSAVFFGRLIPGLETPTTVVAGITMVPWLQFAVSATAAAAITSTAYYCLGSLLADGTARLIARMAGFLVSAPLWLLIFAAVLVAAFAGLRAWHWFPTRR
jgi:membrane protein DedA with SNARE-associated domain